MARVLKGSQFYLHTPRSSANGMNYTCLCLLLPKRYLPSPKGWKAELAWEHGHRALRGRAPLFCGPHFNGALNSRDIYKLWKS